MVPWDLWAFLEDGQPPPRPALAGRVPLRLRHPRRLGPATRPAPGPPQVKERPASHARAQLPLRHGLGGCPPWPRHRGLLSHLISTLASPLPQLGSLAMLVAIHPLGMLLPVQLLQLSPHL